ncbi:MAG: NPCBM/NEW2 domain-containing protein [Pirellulales bacterium]|nr:NPCBM/NEW2 domain-containing protein [Pirellulales bacterium]
MPSILFHSQIESERRTRARIVIAALVLALTPLAASAADLVVLIDGKRLEGKVTSIDENGAVAGEGLDAGLRLSDVREIARSTAERAPESHRVVYLFGGGHIVAKDVTLENEQCAVVLADGTKLDLPMSAIAGVRVLADTKAIKALQNADELASAVAAPDKIGNQDLLFVISKGDDRPDKVQRAPGVFERLAEDEIEFVWKGKKRTVSLDKVYGFALAQVSDPPDLSGHVNVTLADGSQVWCRVTGFKDGKLQVRLPTDTQLTIPWDDVVRLDVRNERLVFLSDLAPMQVSEESIVAFPRSWRRNKNVLAGPLQLGDTKFTKGIGVQPRTSIRFERPVDFDVLAATIGIDAAAKDRGDCEFVVLADDEELFRKRVRGADEPLQLQVSVEDRQTVTLLVEPGEDLDLSDYANWCDVRFIKTDE